MRYIDLEKLITLKGANWKQKKNKWQDPELKKDFREYSYNKCWYSECKLTGNDIDIDHFRPKKAVLQYNDYAYNEKLEKCGYFWLKEEVKNYRGSCIYSNRIRKKGKKEKRRNQMKKVVRDLIFHSVQKTTVNMAKGIFLGKFQCYWILALRRM